MITTCMWSRASKMVHSELSLAREEQVVRSPQDCVWPSRVGSWKDYTLVWGTWASLRESLWVSKPREKMNLIE